MLHEDARPLVVAVAGPAAETAPVLGRARDEARCRHAEVEVVREDPPSASCERAALVVVSRTDLRADPSLGRAGCPLLAVDPDAPVGRRAVVAVLAGTPQDETVVRCAVAEALWRGDPLHLVVGGGPAGTSSARALVRWEAGLREVEGLEVEGVAVDADDPGALARLVGGASLVVVGRTGAVAQLPPGDVLVACPS